MSDFVLDNSVSMRWLLPTSKSKDQNYSKDILRTMTDAEALVPGHWHLEVVNSLLMAEKRKDIDMSEAKSFASRLDKMRIAVDILTADQAFIQTLALAKTYGLSSYDAAYLELAIRESLPLASLDKKLLKAARGTNIKIYLS